MEYTKGNCGCYTTFNSSSYEMIFCPLHKSAPDLYEALNLAFSDLAENGRITEPIERVIKEAIAKVERREH